MNTDTLEINGIDTAKRTFTCVMTKEVVDRDGEVVQLDGLDIEPYMTNPVVMFSHGRDKTAGKIPVGKIVSIKRVNGQIIGEGEMASRPATHPEAEEWLPDTLLSLMQQKCLNAVSIGFIPIQSRRANAEDTKKYGSKCMMVTTKSELFELSLEPTPCNAGALITAVSKGLLPKKSKAWEGEVITEKTYEIPVKIKPKTHEIKVNLKGGKIGEGRAKAIIEARVKGRLYA